VSYEPKAEDELIADIRATAMRIYIANEFLRLPGLPPLAEIQRLEAIGSELAINCKLLRQRLESQDPAIQHLRKTLQEGE
jgi:hypothetical protein